MYLVRSSIDFLSKYKVNIAIIIGKNVKTYVIPFSFNICANNWINSINFVANPSILHMEVNLPLPPSQKILRLKYLGLIKINIL